MLKLKGKLSIGRVSPTAGEDYVRIEVEDADARVEAIEVRVGITGFAKALMAQGYIDCEFEFNDSGKVGTIGQNKTELVPVPPYGERKDGWEAAALAPFEVDGWWARSGDITNGHCAVKQGDQRYQRVVFFRNVPRTEAQS